MNRPRIVYLDDLTINPGDLPWAPLEALGEVVRYHRTAEKEVIPRARPADILLTNKTPISAAMIGQLPQLKYIGVTATGYNMVDIAAARSRGVPVTNVPEYGTVAIAQHTFALLLEMTQHTGHHSDSVRAGRWSACANFLLLGLPLD